MGVEALNEVVTIVLSLMWLLPLIPILLLLMAGMIAFGAFRGGLYPKDKEARRKKEFAEFLQGRIN